MVVGRKGDTEMNHSKIVGGSTAARVIHCPGSVALVDKMPADEGSSYANEGSLLHEAIAVVLDTACPPEDMVGFEAHGLVLTEELLERKLRPALDLLAEYDPEKKLVYITEATVDFGDLLPGVFGSSDIVARLDGRAVILDWKFGDGVMVDAEENMQLMFYAAAAMRTPACQWAFEGVTEVECVIIQPPYIRTWTTPVERIRKFERQLARAVASSALPNAPINMGDHCRWCAAKPICPVKTGQLDRARVAAMKEIDVDKLTEYLAAAEGIEDFIAACRALAYRMLENGVPVPGYKLVNKRATRYWADPSTALARLKDLGLAETDVTKTDLLSVAQAEKVLKKHKIALPADMVVAVSSGTTLAVETDSRPPAVLIGQQLAAALGKIG
jgi:hypothetical protein